MWDLFISHASEDKNNLVRSLSKQLQEVYKVKVWYDEFSLEYGDSLIESIEKGLQSSKFGLVVLSPNFFNKVWTDHEYKSLKTKEMLLNKKVIIPIWLNITYAEIAKYSYTLADKLAISVNSNFDVDDIAIKIIKVVRPDIYENISRMKFLGESVQGSNIIPLNEKLVSSITLPPIRHESISTFMKARLKLVHNAISDVEKNNYEIYEENFRRSVNLDRELIITECLTAAYLDCLNIRPLNLKERELLYYCVFSLGELKAKCFSSNERNKIQDKIDYYLKYIDDAHATIEFKFPDN